MRRHSGEAEIAMTTHHLDALRNWVAHQVGLAAPELEFIAGDASPRQYYRVRCHNGQLGVSACIVMVSPPSENNEAFLHVGRRLAAAGIRPPLFSPRQKRRGGFCSKILGTFSCCRYSLLKTSHFIIDRLLRCWRNRCGCQHTMRVYRFIAPHV